MKRYFRCQWEKPSGANRESVEFTPKRKLRADGSVGERRLMRASLVIAAMLRCVPGGLAPVLRTADLIRTFGGSIPPAPTSEERAYYQSSPLMAIMRPARFSSTRMSSAVGVPQPLRFCCARLVPARGLPEDEEQRDC